MFDRVLGVGGRTVRVVDRHDSRDAVVVLTKYAAMEIDPDDIALLKKWNNRVIVDFVDAVVRHDIAVQADILLASSVMQLRFFRERYPQIASHLIAHHVDLRLRPVAAQQEKFAIAYFGDLLNTCHREALSESVHFETVTGRQPNIGWTDVLPRFNCHYAIRRTRSIDGFKPFTKGFLAAQYGANIVVDRSNAEALHHLGDDYPFVAETGEFEDVSRTIEAARDAFGGPTWQKGLGAMRELYDASSTDVVLGQIAKLMHLL